MASAAAQSGAIEGDGAASSAASGADAAGAAADAAAEDRAEAAADAEDPAEVDACSEGDGDGDNGDGDGEEREGEEEELEEEPGKKEPEYLKLIGHAAELLLKGKIDEACEYAEEALASFRGGICELKVPVPEGTELAEDAADVGHLCLVAARCHGRVHDWVKVCQVISFGVAPLSRDYYMGEDAMLELLVARAVAKVNLAGLASRPLEPPDVAPPRRPLRSKASPAGSQTQGSFRSASPRGTRRGSSDGFTAFGEKSVENESAVTNAAADPRAQIDLTYLASAEKDFKRVERLQPWNAVVKSGLKQIQFLRQQAAANTSTIRKQPELVR
eukprot:TRINITY_DN9504_c0_g1_i1.p1 TRINITY_DN9504_c0_g1~~TRINITY_DN9504_c0_g1_i1.p1  ORF type:complete len:330 (-),score=105.27 TRINITY_DN9504_c0_g1_i1:3-992(-)